MSEEQIEQKDNLEISDEKINSTENEEIKDTKSKKIKYNNQDERHDAILKAKRDYYHRNNDIFKLKSRLRYYNARLQLENINEDQKNKYNTIVADIRQQLANLNSK